MHFSAATLAAFSVLFAAAYASPVAITSPDTDVTTSMIEHLSYVCNAQTSADACSSAKDLLYRKELDGCDVLSCVNRSQSASDSCKQAASTLARDPLLDLKCIANSSNTACDGCHN